MPSITLPANLEDLAIERFDQLLQDGELFYQSSDPEYATHNDFQFEFHITSALKKKPIMAANDPGRKKAVGPFEDPDPKFAITTIGPSHTLELNMFCVHRPSLILHTNAFRPQTEALDESDIAASFSVLRTLNSPHLLFYNCGVEAGSSQGHKHLQLTPKPEAGFEMFLDKEALSSTHPSSIESVPYKHWALSIPEDSTSHEIYEKYLRLLEKTTDALKKEDRVIAYNVVATTKWICLIPRTHKARPDGGAPTNGPGMLGLVWVKNQAERDEWTRLGMTEHLAYLGMPK